MMEFTRREIIIGGVSALSSVIYNGFLEGVGAGDAAKATGKVVAKPFSYIVDSIKYSDYFEEYFLPKKKFHIALASEGVPKGMITYSNEAHAVRAINTELGGSSKILDAESYEIIPNNNDSFIALGGSSTNLLTRSLLGHPEKPQFQYTTGKIVNNLNYSIAKITSQESAVRMQDGKPKHSFRYAIVDRKGDIVAIPEYGTNGEIKSDYLLLTRVNLHPYAGELISFAGLHGPSIRGIAHLINNLSIRDRRFICDTLGNDYSSYQIVFRMDQIIPLADENDNNKLTSTPREVVLHQSNITKITPKII